jgi:proline dehydrogenase
VVTGKLVDTHSESGLLAALITARGGEPLVRKGVDMAMRLMGEQFVTGETISQALERAASCRPEAFAIPTTCSAKPHYRRGCAALHAVLCECDSCDRQGR